MIVIAYWFQTFETLVLWLDLLFSFGVHSTVCDRGDRVVSSEEEPEKVCEFDYILAYVFVTHKNILNILDQYCKFS